jgi:site-specific DNA-methyltransferase (adenine-specific)
MNPPTLPFSAEDATCNTMGDSPNSANSPLPTSPKPWPPAGIKPYYVDSSCLIIHGDCRTILPGLPKVDLVLTDPPYGISIDTDFTKIKDSSAGVSGYSHLRKKHVPVHGDDKPFDPSAFLQFTNVILWGANNYADKLPSGKGKWIVWDKRADNGHALFNDGEIGWVSSKAGVAIFDHCWHGFARASENSEHYHPTQKPVALMMWCLSFFPDAKTILDPFMGSGTTLRAAKDLQRKAIGIEIEEKYCEIAARRLSQEVLPLAV